MPKRDIILNLPGFSIKKGSVRHESYGLYKILLKFKSHKFYCRSCHRYFNQQFPGILKHQRATERLKQQIFHYHTQGICQKSLSDDFKLGKGTIERWYHAQYLRVNQQFIDRPSPEVLGIDEHFFTQKQGFATTLCDLKRNKVLTLSKVEVQKI